MRGPPSLDAVELAEETARGRFEWAVRNGNPRWLWPDVPVDEWNRARAKIERITRQVLVEGTASEQLEDCAAALSIAAFTSGMGPLLGYWLHEGQVRGNAATEAILARHLSHNERRMERMALRAIEVTNAMARRGVATTVLKGMHTANEYFPCPGTRTLSDIDLLIEPHDESEAAGALRELGFEPRGDIIYPERNWRKPDAPKQPKTLCFLHEDDPWSVDLHLTLNSRHATTMPPVRLDDVLSSNPRSWPVSDAARVLAQPSLLLHLTVHAGSPLISLTLLRLCELVFVIRQDTASKALSWNDFLIAGARAGSLGSVYPALHFCEQLAPGTVPQDVRQVCRGQTPVKVLRFIDRLTPATAQSIMRCSLEERFMWLPSTAAVMKQTLHDLLPSEIPIDELLRIYKMRAWRVIQGTVTR